MTRTVWRRRPRTRPPATLVRRMTDVNYTTTTTTTTTTVNYDKTQRQQQTTTTWQRQQLQGRRQRQRRLIARSLSVQSGRWSRTPIIDFVVASLVRQGNLRPPIVLVETEDCRTSGVILAAWQTERSLCSHCRHYCHCCVVVVVVVSLCCRLCYQRLSLSSHRHRCSVSSFAGGVHLQTL